MRYSIPSIQSLDSSNLYLFKNQATCEPGFVTFSQEGGGQGVGFCAYTNFGLGNQVEICLTSNVDPSLLNGLTVNTTNGGPFVTSNCALGDPFSDCDNGIGYLCAVNGTAFDACVTSLECPDGTVITSCGDSGACLNVEVIPVDNLRG